MSATGGNDMSDTMVAERQESRQDAGRDEGRAPAPQPHDREQPTMAPRVDVIEDTTGITLLADLPGVSRDALEIHVEGDALTIEGQVSTVTPQAMEATYAEVRIPRYRRMFTLSRELDGSRIEAQLKDGVLRLRIPKQDHAQPRRVQVKVA